MGTSFLTAAFGIGGGTVLIAAMAVLMPPAALIPVHGVVQFGSNFGRAMLMLKQVERGVLLPFLAGSLAGAALGGLLVVELPPWGIQLAIAAFIAWSVLGRLPAMGRGHVLAGGAVSSFLTMFVGATGGFIAAMLKTMKLEPLGLVATQAVLMTLQHLLKIVAFGLLGFAFGPWLPLVLAMIASGFVGTVVGRQVLVRMKPAWFRSVLNAILLVLAARLAWSGVEGLLAG